MGLRDSAYKAVIPREGAWERVEAPYKPGVTYFSGQLKLD